MKTLLIILLLIIPLTAQTQTRDSILIFQGNGAFDHKIIDLSNGHYKEIPAKAVNMEVEVLILDNNNLTTLPDWLINLPKLRSISIRNNQLNQVDVLMYCSNLEEVYLSENPLLTRLPDFQRCKALRLVDVSHTGIHRLPVEIRGNQSIGYFKYSE